MRAQKLRRKWIDRGFDRTHSDAYNEAIGGITGDAPAAGRGLAADGKFSDAAAHKKRKE